MSVKGRTYPFRVVYQYASQPKPGTVVKLTRDDAEHEAAGIQRRGGSAEVVLLHPDKSRTVVTEYPRLPDDFPRSSGYFDNAVDSESHLRIVNTAGTFTVRLARGAATPRAGWYPEHATLIVREAQRRGYRAEIVSRLGHVLAVFPALGAHVARVGLDALGYQYLRPLDLRWIQEPRPDQQWLREPLRHDEQCVMLDHALLCGMSPHIRDEDGHLAGCCLADDIDPSATVAVIGDESGTPSAGPVRTRCPECGGRFSADHLADAGEDRELGCRNCPWSGTADELAGEPQPAPAEPARGTVLHCPKCFGSRFTGDTPEGRSECSACSWEGPDGELVPFDQLQRRTAPEPTRFCPACSAPADVTADPDPEDDGDAECTSCDWTGGASEVVDRPKSTPAVEYTGPVGRSRAERRADFERILNRAAGDAAVALGGKLGRALGDLLGYIASGEGFTPSGLTGELVELAELVTERAIAARNTPRGGPERADLHRAALNAYSDRWEQSRHQVRDRQAAMQDAIDAVFDTMARGDSRLRVLLRPGGGMAAVGQHHFASVRVEDGELPWAGTEGTGRWSDEQVAGWLEMMPTGRVFNPDTQA
ncbi:MAG: hypothetical protein HOY78_02540 [Saccharothrix sp.]|nr:hypothetical protein [Saccharothrix sp.]